MLLDFLFGKRVEGIDGKSLVSLMATHEKPYVVDVRTLGEFRQGHIPGAHHIPLGEIKNRLTEIPNEQVVVTVCRSGSRSMAAARMLQTEGYQVRNLSGGMNVWPGRVKR